MTRPASGTMLCRLDDIAEPGARGFVFGGGTARWEVFVVRHGGRVRAYENSCPHTGTPLETLPDTFLTANGALILCSTHGARFRPEDGYCVSGPCIGDRLAPVAISIDDDGHVRLGDRETNEHP